LAWLQQRYPGQYADTLLRTLQRRVKWWRATSGPAKEVFFAQVHEPGRLGASDFTHLTSLGVTIQGQPFAHLAYHFVLTYSNWEHVTLCFSESFTSLSEGLQNALTALGRVPQRHRTDRMTLAVHHDGNAEEYTASYRALMSHYQVQPEATNPASGNENGDVESSHRHFKDTLDQALLLRGSRDFASREAYWSLVLDVVARRNAGRQTKFHEELAVMRSLPGLRLENLKREPVRVQRGSTIRVQNNVYSVPARLIGERVEARVGLEHIEVYYGEQLVAKMPRLRNQDKHRIDYRHIIDWLVRKPGAFAQYRYLSAAFSHRAKIAVWPGPRRCVGIADQGW
jgi:transposase